MKKITRMVVVTDDPKLEKVLKFCFDGWGYEVFFVSSGNGLAQVRRLSPDAVVVDVEKASSRELLLCDQLKKDFATSSVPVIALVDKRHLRMRLLELSYGVDDYLIKPPDPLELRVRIEMAIRRSQQSFHANPLTGLPGGVAAEEILKERVESASPFVSGHLDIDNFKSFNDKYGYMKGDRVLMQTAYMLSSVTRQWGGEDDFVGHIGGDDFVLITTPEKYNTICSNFICMFDTVIPFHYDMKSREKGYIRARTRTGEMKKIPLMTVTIALVMSSVPGEIASMIELNERISEVKKYLKEIEGSKYMADRRVAKKNDHLKVQVFKNEDSLAHNYRPLGQVLLNKKMLTEEQLDEALRTHWKRGSMLGEVLTEMGYLTERELETALKEQGEYL